ncbi:DUF1266 domain-containing protein [Clavibacter sp. Sh2036]|uniref:DUF1266 domain-containing protein n=1 Tax=Clavibacter sp. Sh2036 TaxID=3397677 RepID=UPI0039E16AD0
MGLFSAFKKFLDGPGFVTSDNSRELDADERRAIAMGHIYAREGGLPINALTMEADQPTTAKLLARAWNVVDHDSYLDTMGWLRQSGHRSLYPIVTPLVDRSIAERAWPKAANAIQAEGVAEAERQGLDGGQAALFFQGWLRSTVSGGRAELPTPLPASIAAWDCARAVQLSRLAVDAGFTTDAEAFGLLTHFVAISREHHQSWQEFGDAFVTGRAFWSAKDVKNPVDQELSRFTLARDDLITREDSPWQTAAW